MTHHWTGRSIWTHRPSRRWAFCRRFWKLTRIAKASIQIFSASRPSSISSSAPWSARKWSHLRFLKDFRCLICPSRIYWSDWNRRQNRIRWIFFRFWILLFFEPVAFRRNAFSAERAVFLSFEIFRIRKRRIRIRVTVGLCLGLVHQPVQIARQHLPIWARHNWNLVNLLS